MQLKLSTLLFICTALVGIGDTSATAGEPCILKQILELPKRLLKAEASSVCPPPQCAQRRECLEKVANAQSCPVYEWANWGNYSSYYAMYYPDGSDCSTSFPVNLDAEPFLPQGMCAQSVFTDCIDLGTGSKRKKGKVLVPNHVYDKGHTQRVDKGRYRNPNRPFTTPPGNGLAVNLIGGSRQVTTVDVNGTKYTISLSKWRVRKMGTIILRSVAVGTETNRPLTNSDVHNGTRLDSYLVQVKIGGDDYIIHMRSQVP